MKVWVNDVIIKSALADCEGAGRKRGFGQQSFARSESGGPSGPSSLDVGLSSRRVTWAWVESVVVSGSAQGLFAQSPSGGGATYFARPPPAGGGARGAGRADDEIQLAVRVTDPSSEFNGRVVRIARRNLHAAGGRGVLPANAGDADPLPADLTQLTHLHEPAVVDCLRRRYDMAGWEMYTSSGPILIAINPCRNFPGLYDEGAMRMYWQRGERLAGGALSPGGVDGGSDKPPPPHVFGVADAAYRGMMRGLDFARNILKEEKEEEILDVFANQSVLVSGESGAGKTVTTKFIMQYLASLSEKVDLNHASSSEKSSIEQRVLQSNAILEAFGNARTLRNDNSSRFGKFIELRFSERGRLAGASIDTYLLEKARIVGHTCGERTYHIFYEVLAKGSLAAAERKKFFISNSVASDFAITTPESGKNKSQLLHNAYDDHAKMFEELRIAMNTMGFGRLDQMEIYRTVCGLLHLSNLTLRGAFVEMNDGEECRLNESWASLHPALTLLGVPYEALNNAVTTVQFSAVGELVKKNLTVMQAVRAVQALIKGVYNAIFSLLVDRINSFIAGSSSSEEVAGEGAFIGLLDIFGFESFDTNSFEQLLINFCNESLQQQFNRFVFKLEQQEYKREGIKWDMIQFEDNQDILDLIERRHGGILTILDEQCKLGMRCNDRTFVSAVYNKCMDTSNRFDATRKQQSLGSFSIQHYAGVVEYDTTGFMEKNKDEIPMEASNLFLNSSCPFIQDVGLVISLNPNGNQKPNQRLERQSSISRVSVGGQFSSQLQELRRRIDETHPHYVRCLKPNDQLQPGRFDPHIVVDQLRCGGILEAIRVSRAGFPHRYTFEHFHSRFGLLYFTLSSCQTKQQRPQRRVGKLNIGGSFRGRQQSKRKVVAPQKPKTDHKKGCEALVQIIAQWILAEREKEKNNDTDHESETVQTDVLSPRSFWKSQSPQKHQNNNNLIHKRLDTSKAGIQMGATKVFLLQETFDAIERVRGQALATGATKISSLVRMYLARQRFLAILISYREAMNHRSTGGPAHRIFEAKSEDHSVFSSEQVDINLEFFETRSNFEMANSFIATEKPQEYEWVSIGHGRFIKREIMMSSQEFNPDYVDL